MYYNIKDRKHYFKGLIATYRKYKRKKCNLTFVTIGYDNGKYLDISINGNVNLYNKDVIEGHGKFSNHMIQVENYKCINL